MNPVPIPEAAKAQRPWAEPIVVGPPVNDTIGCRAVEALVGETPDEGLTFRIPYRPDEDDLAALNRGEPVWIALYCLQMPPVSVYVGEAG